MKHWWSNVKVIVCGIVRCNELKTRCTKIKIYHCVHFSFQVSSAVNSTESNLIDLQPRVGLWACQYWELQISLLLFADYKWRTLRTCDCGAACRWGFAHAFFFFFPWPSDTLRVKCGTCYICCLQSVPDCSPVQKEQPSQDSGCRQVTVILYDQGSGQHWESTFIHHPSCRLFVSDFCLCLDSHALVLLSTPSLGVPLAELSHVPRNQWVINMVL